MARFPKELTDLVADSFEDGVLTSKERQVLLKKAEKLGIDTEEFDLYLDAQQQKADQSVEAAVAKRRGSTCPYCGGSVPALADKCPHCNQYITIEATNELKEILENLEDALLNIKIGKDVEYNNAILNQYSRKARLYYNNHPKISALLNEIDKEISAAQFASKKKELMNLTIKNKFFWRILPLALGVIIIFIGFMFEDPHGPGNIASLGFFFLAGGFIYNVYLMEKGKDK